MKSYSFNTPSEAYLAILKDVYENPTYICSPRGFKVHEITDVMIEIKCPDSNPLVTKDVERNKVIAIYTSKEKEVYESGSVDVKDFEKISKFWGKLANPDGTVNSAYGYLIKGLADHGNPMYESMRVIDGKTYYLAPEVENQMSEIQGSMRTPWLWCVESLKADKDTRQAIMRFSRPSHFYKGVKDFTCTLHANWLIRDGKLNLTVVMRSNDMFRGTVYDWPYFMGLMDEMLEELKPTYPDLQKGRFTHIAHSLHIYEDTFEAVKKMIGAIK
jgi:thymidylate synthase